ncbi:MAG: sigma-70 family RNA polymerase sigma factor [Thermoanaerobaculia bacterium]
MIKENSEKDLKQLVVLSAKGDEEAISELISMHKKLIGNIVHSVLRDWYGSIDIIQETFIYAFRNINKLKDPEKFKSWICKIAYNLSINELKRRNLEREYTEKMGDINYLLEDDKTNNKKIIIEEALQKLKVRDRMVLVLYYYQGFNLKEIEQITGIKEENLKMILCRARKKLREKLEGYEYELLS